MKYKFLKSIFLIVFAIFYSGCAKSNTSEDSTNDFSKGSEVDFFEAKDSFSESVDYFGEKKDYENDFINDIKDAEDHTSHFYKVKCSSPQRSNKNIPYLALSAFPSDDNSIVVKIAVANAENVVGVSFHLDYNDNLVDFLKIESDFSSFVNGKFWKFLYRHSQNRIVGAIGIFEEKSLFSNNDISVANFDDEKIIAKIKFKIKKIGNILFNIDFKDSLIMTDKGFLKTSKYNINCNIEE